MKRTFHTLALLLFLMMQHEQLKSQEDKKITFTGAARSLFYADKLEQEGSIEDTVTIPKLNSGHVLVDLGVTIRPNKNTEILGMVRIRNDYGGFWGSGVTFDVRQLYMKGVIGGIVRYQLGDINYKMTPFTFWNYDQEVISQTPSVFQQQTDIVNYDNFNPADNSRRQQGAAAECALVFRKWVKELQFHAVTTRVKTSNFASVNDRLFSGLNAHLVQSKYFEIGVNFASMYDVKGTSRNNSTFHNPVLTGNIVGKYELSKIQFLAEAEFGKSSTKVDDDNAAPSWNDNFVNAKFKISHEVYGIHLKANTIRVGSAFRSPGAQTKRIDYNGVPSAYSRISNDQQLRPGTILDLMRESDYYNLQLQPYLMAFNPTYDNITPYGDATHNRQGFSVGLQYAKKDNPLTAEVTHTQLQEMRGEGTLIPRKFMRNAVTVSIHPNEYFKNWKKQINISFGYRNDQTKRDKEELVIGVDLKTKVMSIGLEIETLESLDILLGMQTIDYSGIDYVAVRNIYSEIYNFTEYKSDGTETMQAIGLRYRFSEKSFLSAQFNTFNVSNANNVIANYTINQIMLLFQMKF